VEAQKYDNEIQRAFTKKKKKKKKKKDSRVLPYRVHNLVTLLLKELLRPKKNVTLKKKVMKVLVGLEERELVHSACLQFQIAQYRLLVALVPV
jgi:hypothetical protein